MTKGPRACSGLLPLTPALPSPLIPPSSRLTDLLVFRTCQASSSLCTCVFGVSSALWFYALCASPRNLRGCSLTSCTLRMSPPTRALLRPSSLQLQLPCNFLSLFLCSHLSSYHFLTFLDILLLHPLNVVCRLPLKSQTPGGQGFSSFLLSATPLLCRIVPGKQQVLHKYLRNE